ncbi:chloroplast outer envelope protein 37 isoform X2 [Wolffia australiana]
MAQPAAQSLQVAQQPSSDASVSVAAPKNRSRPAVRVTSEYDSDSQVFYHKVSCKIIDELAKLRISFMNNRDGEISTPMIRLDLWKRLVVDYDVEARNAFVRGTFDVGKNVEIETYHDLKEKKGEVMMTTILAQPSYKLSLVSAVPSFSLPKARLQFPRGEVSIEERQDEQGQKTLSMDGILRGKALGGVCTAQFVDANLKANDSDRNMKLRYCYKDEQMTFIPEIVLPYNAVSVTFKRQFGPSDKLR